MSAAHPQAEGPQAVRQTQDGQPQDGQVGRWQVLSCYTANVAAYLEQAAPAAQVSDRIARSARLSVRTDLADGIAFSHHSVPLHHLPGGDTLRYTGADLDEQVTAGLRAEYERWGAVLVLAHSSRLPWSLAGPDSDGPHFLLLDGHDPRRGRWHAVDHFAGLMPSGLRQEPYAGWIGTAVTVDALRGPRAFTEGQERRNGLAFGFPLELPAARCRWLVRTGPRPSGGSATGQCVGPTEPLPGTWLHEPEDVWSFLAERLRDQMTRTSQPVFLDDLWAASQHHRHRCARLLASGSHAGPGRGPGGDPSSELPDGTGDLGGGPACTGARREAVTAAESAWAGLPQTLRFAADSARRGRPRDALVATTVKRLAEREQEVRDAFPGYALSAPAAWRVPPRTPEEEPGMRSQR
jgi:hypothetical protein